MIQSVERALNILELLSGGKNGRELGLVEIATALHLDKSTIYNLIKTLQSRGYVDQDARGRKYRQSRKFLALAQGGVTDERLSEMAEATCVALQKKIGEPVSFVTYRGGEVKILCRILCTNDVVVAPYADKPLYSTVSGRCLLAQLPEDQVDEVLEKYALPGETWPEVNSRKRLLIELNRIKSEGHAVLRSEKRQVGGIGSIVPADKSIAPLAIGTAMPLFRFDVKSDALAPLIVKYASKLAAVAKGVS